MALGKHNLKNLEKSAGNFLYAFIPLNHKGLSQDVYKKRDKQLEELQEVYAHNEGVTPRELRNIVYNGIVKRYGMTPYKLLNEIIVKSNRYPGIGAVTLSDEEAAKAVSNISANVTENGKTKKKNVWKDIVDVLQYLLDFINKIFGKYNDPEVYRPVPGDYSYENRPKIQGPPPQESSMGLMPLLLIGGAGFYLMNNQKAKTKPKRKQK